MAQDWTGNKQTVSVTLGTKSENYTTKDREQRDYYATEPKALELLLELEQFNNVWENVSGGGHLVGVLKAHNIYGRHSDIFDYNNGAEILDFLDFNGRWNGDIITNPPYKYADSCIRKSLESIDDGNKLALLFPIRYLEGKARKEIYKNNPPYKIYASSGRIKCAMNGKFAEMKGSAVSYMWIVWIKGYTGETSLKWFN